jgi:hypothetical protein
VQCHGGLKIGNVSLIFNNFGTISFDDGHQLEQSRDSPSPLIEAKEEAVSQRSDDANSLQLDTSDILAPKARSPERVSPVMYREAVLTETAPALVMPMPKARPKSAIVTQKTKNKKVETQKPSRRKKLVQKRKKSNKKAINKNGQEKRF